jgi:hypothetical protein
MIKEDKVEEDKQLPEGEKIEAETFVESTTDDVELDNIVGMFSQYETLASEDTDLADALAQVKARKAEDELRGSHIDQTRLVPKPLAEKIAS